MFIFDGLFFEHGVRQVFVDAGMPVMVKSDAGEKSMASSGKIPVGWLYYRAVFRRPKNYHDHRTNANRTNLIKNLRFNHGKGSMKKLLIVLASVLLFAPAAWCAGDVLQDVKQLQIVKDLFPPEVELIEARDMGNLFEVVLKDQQGKHIFYVTKDGAYVFAGGNLISSNKVNLTQVRYEEINRVDISKLPLQDAIQIKKGNGNKKLVLFLDVDCPYCRKASDWLKNQTNYTLYVFMFPLDMHPKSAGKSVQVLCSANRETALDNAQSDKDIGSQKCAAGEKMLAKHQSVGKEIGVDGTPLFITDTGKRITGLQTQPLESYLKD